MATNLDDGTILLQPLSTNETNAMYAERQYMAWSYLVNRSVEAVLDRIVGMYDFLDHERCLCLSSIVLRTPQDPDAYELLIGSDDPTPAQPLLTTIGLIYVTSTDLPSTINIGLSLCPDAWGCGYGSCAVRLLVEWAFRELGVHRVQARVINLEDDSTDVALQMFTALGFVHEGTSRRALFCPMDSIAPGGTNGLWRDVTTYAILDTDWSSQQAVHRNTAMKSMWDTLFTRHELESEALLRLEERTELRRRRARMIASGELSETVDDSTQQQQQQQALVSFGAALANKTNTWIWESEDPGYATPTRSGSDSPSLSQSSHNSRESPSPDPSAAASSSSALPTRWRFNQPPWSELFNTPYESQTPDANTPYESAAEIPEDGVAESAGSSFSSVGREDLSDGELVSDVESVVSVPRSPSVDSDSSTSSWFDNWGEAAERENSP